MMEIVRGCVWAHYNRETILAYSVLICTRLDASEEYVVLRRNCLKVF